MSEHLVDGDVPDLLVRNAHLGEPLAAYFDGGAKVALMRGHGMTVIAPGIEEVVSRSVYTMKNASIQTAALTMQSAFAAQSDGSGTAGLKFLDERESKAATESKHHPSPFTYPRLRYLGIFQDATLEAP